jgi:molybdate transport system permease protein
METQALWLTLRLAATTTLILLVIAVPLAWWIASGRGAIRAVVQAIVALPLVLPPTVIGFYLLIGLGPLTPFGRAVTHALGHPLAFTFSGLVVGSILYSLPFAVMPLVAGFESLGREYAEAAAMLGASPLRSFFDVTLPLARPALLSAAVLVFLHTVGEFGVVLMIGGNIPGVTQTLSISIFDLVEDGRYADANRIALLLIAFAIAGLALVYARRPRRQLA